MNKIFELLIDWDNEEFEDLGVDIMSLVDRPAIGVSWQAFAAQQFVDPQPGEAEEDYIGRCIPTLIEEGYTPEEAAAICYSSYEERAEEFSFEAAQEWAIQLFQQCGENYSLEDVEVPQRDQFADLTVTEIAKGITALDILGKRDATREGVTKYRYAGPAAERNFCKAMLRMNKLYSAEDLVNVGNQMASRFSSIYPQTARYNPNTGQFIGGVAQWLGGPSCKHYWEEVEVFDEPGEPKVVVSKGRAAGDLGVPMHDRPGQGRQFSWHFSDDQMIVTGPAMIADMLIPRKDERGNLFHVFFSADTVKKIAKKFLEQSNHNNTDINHDNAVVQENVLLESWIVEDPEMDKAKALGFQVPKNTWMVSYKINNQDTWKKIKSGELTGFSVAGDFAEKLLKN